MAYTTEGRVTHAHSLKVILVQTRVYEAAKWAQDDKLHKNPLGQINTATHTVVRMKRPVMHVMYGVNFCALEEVEPGTAVVPEVCEG